MTENKKILTPVKPFRLIGNVYFVGSVEASSHLIDTGDGLILIDTGYEESAEGIVRSVRELGFAIEDVKYILHSHGHYDHTDATARLLSYAPAAKTLLCFRDLRYVRGFTPDVDLGDGYELALGNVKIDCVFSPGHTEGSFSFFFDVEEKGERLRVGMFGGAGVNQLKKDYMHRKGVSYLLRGQFFDTVEKLRGEHVDVMLGNHTWHNDTVGRAQRLSEARNPFIDPSEWGRFLEKLSCKLDTVIRRESREKFVNYAHRGASEYCPENTLLSFYTGLYMGANGIETDVRMTRDGVAVLFHDHTLLRTTEQDGAVEDYTYEELCAFAVQKNGLSDRIPTLTDFLDHVSHFSITLAVELKADGTEQTVADEILRRGIADKTIVTSFSLERLANMRKYAPTIRTGYLAKEVDGELLSTLLDMGVEELCPRATQVTAEDVKAWHRMGFNVRAWGVSSEELMRGVYDAGADGMTVNFPDRLTAYIRETERKVEEQA